MIPTEHRLSPQLERILNNTQPSGRSDDGHFRGQLVIRDKFTLADAFGQIRKEIADRIRQRLLR